MFRFEVVILTFVIGAIISLMHRDAGLAVMALAIGCACINVILISRKLLLMKQGKSK